MTASKKRSYAIGVFNGMSIVSAHIKVFNGDTDADLKSTTAGFQKRKIHLL